MPPIMGPTHRAPGSKHMDCSHVYVEEHIDLLTPSVSQREETTAPARCAKKVEGNCTLGHYVARYSHAQRLRLSPSTCEDTALLCLAAFGECLNRVVIHSVLHKLFIPARKWAGRQHTCFLECLSSAPCEDAVWWPICDCNSCSCNCDIRISCSDSIACKSMIRAQKWQAKHTCFFACLQRPEKIRCPS